MSTQNAIVVENIGRTYTSSKGVFKRTHNTITALNDVSLSVPHGELFGLLGPNGAGKTTLTKILTTILLPTSGRAEVLGLDVAKDFAKLRPRIGIIFGGERGLYWRLSGQENMEYFASLYKVPPAVAKERIPQLLKRVGLSGRENERVEGYSRGMKQRLHIARGLIHDPDILFLDEPTIGLDPVAARDLRLVIRELQAAGKTIFLTSHYMFEMDELCDRVAVLKKGKILQIATPKAMKDIVADLEVVEVECYGASAEMVNALRAHDAVSTVNIKTRDQTQLLEIQARDGASHVQDFLACLGDIRVKKVTNRQPTLEDAYIKMMEADA